MKATASIRLRYREPLAKGVRRIARGQIDTACHFLKSPEDVGEAIHEARKALKKLRALLQLVRPEFGRAQLQREKARFRDVARLLAPARDTQVRLQTFEALLHGAAFAPEEFAPAHAGLQAAADRELCRAEPSMRRAAEMLRQARASVRHWPLAGLEWESIEREIRRAYRKGRQALRDYQRQPTPEAFHAWRKRLKKTWYHLRITRNLLPRTAKRIGALEELGELAGSAHDLIVLRKTLAAQKPGVQTALLLGEIDARLPELYKAALQCGVKGYAEKPRDFARG